MENKWENKKKQLGKLLSVPDRTIRGWLSRIDKDAKESRDKRIFDMWLGCYSYEEIAKIVDSSPTEAKRVVSSETAELPNRTKPASEHLTDFEPPIYNIWKQQKKSQGSNHFGNFGGAVVG